MGISISIPPPVIEGVATLLGPYLPSMSKQEISEHLGSLGAPPTSAPTPARLLTIAEVAQRLSLGRRTVWRMVERGKLPKVNLGFAVRFRESDVLALMQRGT